MTKGKIAFVLVFLASLGIASTCTTTIKECWKEDCNTCCRLGEAVTCTLMYCGYNFKTPTDDRLFATQKTEVLINCTNPEGINQTALLAHNFTEAPKMEVNPPSLSSRILITMQELIRNLRRYFYD